MILKTEHFSVTLYQRRMKSNGSKFVTLLKWHYLLTYVRTCLLTDPWNRVLLEKLTGSQLDKKFSAFLETEGSLQRSKQLDTRFYPKPDQSTSCPSIPLPDVPFYIIFPSTPVSSKWPPSFKYSHQNPVCTSPLPYTCYMPRSSYAHVITRIIFG
jgi:hypothetical protein